MSKTELAAPRQLLILAGLTAMAALALSASASASVSYFNAQGCIGLTYRASEEPSQISRAKVPEYRRALDSWIFNDVANGFVVKPPVNWRKAPSADARSKLHQMKFLDRLFGISENILKPQKDHDPFSDADREQAVRNAVAIVADWARAANAGKVPAKEAWKHRVAGLRLPYLAFAARRAACAGALSEADAVAIKKTLPKHAKILGSRPPASTPENHKLTFNKGAALLAYYFPNDPQMTKAAAKAEKRFLIAAAKGFDHRDGFWLEHSPRYHRLAVEELASWLSQVGTSPAVQRVHDKLLETLGWLLLPNNRLVTFGDTSGEEVKEGKILGARQAGFRAFRTSGYAMYSSAERWFGLTAQYHARQHKQADELSFDLFDGGQHLIQDTGFFDKAKRAVHKYQAHARAHSTLTVNGQSFNHKIHQKPYGSGILAAGSGNGWHGVQARNPLLIAPKKLTKSQRKRSKKFRRKAKRKLKKLAKKNVDHTRTYLYKPGEALVIADRARSKKAKFKPAIQRHFQFGPAVDATKVSDSRLDFQAGGLSGRAVTDASLPSSLAIVEGRDNPLQGYAYPLTGKVEPRPAAIWTAKGKALDAVTVIAYDTSRIHGVTRTGSFSKGGIELSFLDPLGDAFETVKVQRSGASLTITP